MAAERTQREPAVDRVARWAARGTSRREAMKVAGAGALAYYLLGGRIDASFAQAGRCDACSYTYQGCMNPKLKELEREYKGMTGDGNPHDARQRAFETVMEGQQGRGRRFVGGIKDGELGYQIGIAIRQRYKLGQAREQCRAEERECLAKNPPCGRCQSCDINGACQPCSAQCRLCDFDTGKCGSSMCRNDQQCCNGKCVDATELCCPPGASTCTAGGDGNCCYSGETCCATTDRALCCGGSRSACCRSTNETGQQYADCYDPSTHTCCAYGGVVSIEFGCQ